MQERKCKHAGLSEEEERAGMTKRYFEGELKSLRDKLGEKDVSLAKASRIQKELRWSLELYNRELSMIRGASSAKKQDPRAGNRRERESPAANRTGPQDVGATSLWYSPLPDGNGTASSYAVDSPAPVPPPRRRKPNRQGALGIAGADMLGGLSESSPSPPPVRRDWNVSSSSSSSPPSERGRLRTPRETDENETWQALFGPENKGLAVALRAAVVPSTSILRTSPTISGAASVHTPGSSTQDRGIHSRGRWSPPSSLSPPANARTSRSLGGSGSAAETCRDESAVGSESSERDRQSERSMWSSSPVGALELKERMRADIDAKVNLLLRLKHERDSMEDCALRHQQVGNRAGMACAGVS